MAEIDRDNEGMHIADKADQWVRRKPSERPREIYPVTQQRDAKNITLAELIHNPSIPGALAYVRGHPVLWGVGAALGLTTLALIARDGKSRDSGDINLFFVDSELFER